MPLYNGRSPLRRIVNQLERVAEQVLWTPSALCPCTSGGSGLLSANQADPTHSLCAGTGHIPLTSQQRMIRAVISKYSVRWSQLESAEALIGDLLVSPIPRDPVLLNKWDQLRMPGWEDGEAYGGELVQIPSIGPRTTHLVYTPKRIEQCFSVVGTTITNYAEGIDFTRAGALLTWPLAAPAAGTVISVKYRAIIDYVIVDVPEQRYERNSSIGQRALARRRDLAMRAGPAIGSDVLQV